MKSVDVTVSGVVQGVYYRASAAREPDGVRDIEPEAVAQFPR